MENATKALTMAAGIFMAIILLSAFLLIFSSAADVQAEKNSQKEMERIRTFNKSYEAYQRNLLRGVDISSLANKAVSDNIKDDLRDLAVNIHVKIKLLNGAWEVYGTKNGTSQIIFQKRTNDYIDLITDRAEWNFDNWYNSSDKNEKKKFDEFKTKYFKCDKIEYNNVTGLVSALYFTERSESQIFAG